MKSIRQQTAPGVCWKTLAVFLLGLYFPASTLTAFPGLHNHSGLSTFGSEGSHVTPGEGGEGGHDESKPGAPDSHGQENCQICHIQSALADSLLSTGPSFSLVFLVQWSHHQYSSPHVQQFRIAERHLRGPPLLPSI